MLTRSLAIAERVHGLHHPEAGMALHNLALIHQDQERYLEAEGLLQRAVAAIEATSVEHPHLAIIFGTYATLLRTTGREMEAATLTARAETIRGRYQS